jgi:hypothetical protein
VTKIHYGMGSVTYSTFDPVSEDVLRLNFDVASIWSGGRKLPKGTDAAKEGYSFDEATKVLRIRHTQSRDVDVQGKSAALPALLVDFDHPHMGANAPLTGQYPSGVIDWGKGQWKVCIPDGRMSTFSLCTEDPKATRAAFVFAFPRTLTAIEVFNPLRHEVELTLRAPEMREVTFRLKPGELRRIKTEWTDRASRVSFEALELGSLRIDNLAYSLYLSARLDQ